jgi:hypothetical protein
MNTPDVRRLRGPVKKANRKRQKRLLNLAQQLSEFAGIKTGGGVTVNDVGGGECGRAGGRVDSPKT